MNLKKIPFGGPNSRNPLEFQSYDRNRVVGGKKMKDHLRFAMAWWHSFCLTGADPFGQPTLQYPWDSIQDPVSRGLKRMDHAFEMLDTLGIEFYCFHDVDFVELTDDAVESDRRLQRLVDHAKQLQKDYNVRLLWGTANLTGHPRYMNGASTNPDFRVVSKAADQVKRVLDATIELGGENFVFWGGREGYQTLHNTDMKREKAHYARFLELARDYGRKQGFAGTFLIEPKPMEPNKHQYDYDAETAIGFLKQHGLERDFKLNIEVNHATLSGHSFTHDLQVAADHGMLGSIDANRGDHENGWDTDQFPINVQEITEAMMIILEAGGFMTGGINFDAKIRRNSIDAEDILIAHIHAMDTFAKGLVAAHAILEESPYREWREQRYKSFLSPEAQQFETGQMSLEELAMFSRTFSEPVRSSGKQERLESLLSRYI
jgi:xylose isomerase